MIYASCMFVHMVSNHWEIMESAHLNAQAQNTLRHITTYNNLCDKPQTRRADIYVNTQVLLNSSQLKPHGMSNNVAERLDRRTHLCQHGQQQKQNPNIFSKTRFAKKQIDFWGRQREQCKPSFRRGGEAKLNGSPNAGPRNTLFVM